MGHREVMTRAARIWVDDEAIVRCEGVAGVAQTTADAEEAMAALWALAGHRRLPVIVDMRSVASLDRGARVHYSGAASAARTLAVGILVGSPLSRALGNFFLGLNKPMIPTRLFTSDAEALTWLRGFRAEGLDGGAR